MNEMKMKELAEEHYTYVESVCHKMYVDAFVHGIKHGQEEKAANTKTSKLIETINDRISYLKENRIEVCNYHTLDGTPADKTKLRMLDLRTGNIESLYWVLDQLETKKTKTYDYEGCNSYVTDC